MTPEGVPIDFETAGVGSRLLARLLDLVLTIGVGVPALLLILAFTAELGLPLSAVTIASIMFVALALGYPIAIESVSGGRTVGKMAVGLRVLTTEGAPARFRHFATRGAIGLADVFLSLGSLGFATIMMSSREQRLGDLVAGTMVVNERASVRYAAPTQFVAVAGHEGYAATLDPSVLSTRDYVLVRAVLLRRSELDHAAFAALAHDLAGRLAERLSHTPPAGMDAGEFLVDLAARYQERHGDGFASTAKV